MSDLFDVGKEIILITGDGRWRVFAELRKFVMPGLVPGIHVFLI